MNEDLCPLSPIHTPVNRNSFLNKTNWQNIAIVICFLILFLFAGYFFYKFISHTNKRFEMVGNAINQLNDRINTADQLQQQRTRPPQVQQQQQPQPQPHSHPQQQHQYASHPNFQQQVVHQQQQQAPVKIDTRTLDMELSSELEELNHSKPIKVDEPEGRIDTITKIEPNVETEIETEAETETDTDQTDTTSGSQDIKKKK